MTGAPDDGASGSERYHHRRPIDRPFYERLATHTPAGVAGRGMILEPRGAVIDLDAGEVMTITLLCGPQVVLLQAWDRQEPRERIWCQETSSLEDCFLRPMGRLWGTMPWFHPLLTLVDDSVESRDATNEPRGGHHFVLDGWETPAAWAADGGDPAIPTAWDHFRRLLSELGMDPSLHRDHVALFRKVVIDPDTQRLRFPCSDARAGDRVALFAERDLGVALVPSPYGGGGRSAGNLDGSVGGVLVEHWRSGARPIGWPYPGVGHPEIAPYVAALEADTAEGPEGAP